MGSLIITWLSLFPTIGKAILSIWKSIFYKPRVVISNDYKPPNPDIKVNTNNIPKDTLLNDLKKNSNSNIDECEIQYYYNEKNESVKKIKTEPMRENKLEPKKIISMKLEE